MNEEDSEKLSGMLKRLGYTRTEDKNEKYTTSFKDIYDNSIEEAIDIINKINDYFNGKKIGKTKGIIMVCLIGQIHKAFLQFSFFLIHTKTPSVKQLQLPFIIMFSIGIVKKTDRKIPK